jgi:hypothetical protein
MPHIRTLPEAEATGKLRELYDADLKNNGYVANYTKAMSLRPVVIAAWRTLSGAIRGNMELRRYELVTIATAAKLCCKY